MPIESKKMREAVDTVAKTNQITQALEEMYEKAGIYNDRNKAYKNTIPMFRKEPLFGNESLTKLYNGFHQTNHASLPGFFTAYESAREFGLNATITPLSVMSGAVLFALGGAVLSLINAGFSTKNLFQGDFSKVGEMIKSLVTCAVCLAMSAASIPLVSLGFIISYATRTLATAYSLLSKAYDAITAPNQKAPELSETSNDNRVLDEEDDISIMSPVF